jgi:hypothetical protein
MSSNINYIIRNCLTNPLMNIQPSDIDNQYHKQMRHFINKNIDDFINSINITNYYIVDIGLTGYAKHFKYNVTMETIDIDPTNSPTYICDITKNNSNIISSNKYDITIITEVLEHTEHPIDALYECYRITKNGGYIIITNPLNFRIHGPLYDNFRLTEWFYINFCKKNNIKIIIFNALEDTSRKLFPISYFIVLQK